MNGYTNTNGIPYGGLQGNNKLNEKSNDKTVSHSPKPGYINEKLPKELFIMIFGYLDITALCRCSQVCKFWYEIAFDGSNWKTINLFDFQKDITSNVVSKITEISGRFLRELRMKGCIHISDKDIKNLAEQCPLIEDLTLSECVNLTNESSASVTRNCTNLTSLYIDSCTKINDDGIKEIGNCKNLMKLDLSFCDISDEGLRYIARGCPLLTFLRLKGCTKITSNGISEIAKSCPKLRLINCNYVGELLTDKALALLARYCSELRTLCVSNCNITDAGLKALAGNISAFSLDKSDIDSGEGDNMHNGVKQFGCRELTVVEVSRCRITDTGISLLAGACSRLEKLDLEDCASLTDGSLTFLSIHCPKLRILLLSHCDQITDNGVQKLVEMSTGGCRNLEYLALDNCPLLTDESLVCLSKNCAFLKKLDLYDCQLITKQSIQRVQSLHVNLIIQSYFAPNTPDGGAAQRHRRVCRCCIIC